MEKSIYQTIHRLRFGYFFSTTKENLNEWVSVKANVKENFKKLHDLDVDILDGVAIMTDTDNSKKKSNCLLSKHFFFHL